MSIDKGKIIWKKTIRELKSREPLFPEGKYLQDIEITLYKDKKILIFLNREDYYLLKNNYFESIRGILSKKLKKDYPIEFKIREEGYEFVNNHKSILKKYPHHTYIVSEDNKTTFSSLKKFIEEKHNGGGVYYLWGSQGIGKTHLVVSLIRVNPEIKTIYIDALDYIDKYYEFKKSSKSFSAFNQWMLTYEIIIFDSFEKLKNKKNASRVVLDLIKSIKGLGKKIIFISTCDSVLDNFEKNIFSSFSIISKLNAPGIKDVGEIINKFILSQNRNISLDRESCEYLVDILGNNIQVIINKLSHILFLFGNPEDSTIVTLDILKKTLKKIDFLKESKELINYSNNQQVKSICERFNFNVEEVLKDSKRKNIVWKRNIVIYILKTRLNLTHQDIGKIFKKNNSTISYAIKSVEKLMEDKNFRKYIEEGF